MLEYFKKIFLPDFSGKETLDNNKRLQIATCALFIEMAKADSDFSDDEKEKIISIMSSFFKLDDAEISELMDLAEEDIKESISIYEFTDLLNQSFSNAQKYELIKNMWRLIYIDEKLDKYEDHLIKRIGTMLLLDFQDIIAAKLEVKSERNN